MGLPAPPTARPAGRNGVSMQIPINIINESHSHQSFSRWDVFVEWSIASRFVWDYILLHERLRPAASNQGVDQHTL